MARHDSRAQQFAKIWLGPSAAMLVGFGSTVAPAAMPIPAAQVEVPGPTLIQSPGPSREAQQPAGTPPAASADESDPDSFNELHRALTEARQRLGHLARAADAVAAAEQLQREVAALQEENQKVRAEVDGLRAERGELETARQTAEAHAAKLSKRLEETTAKTQEVEEELAAVRAQSEQRIAAADAARNEAEARLSEMRDSLQRAEQEGARADELTKALEEAGAKVLEMEEELAAVRAQGERRIASANAARKETEARLSEMRTRTLSHQRLGRHLTDRLQRAEQEKARVDADLARIQGELATAKEQVATARQEQAQLRQRVAALEDERDESEQRIAAVDAARVEAEARLSEMRDSLQRAEQEKARIGADLARIQGELATAKEQVVTAGRERAEIEQWAAALQSERDDLRTRLRDATARLEPTEAANAQLEREVAKLRQAARTAAEDTRQLIETLAAIGLSAGPLEADAALLAESGAPSAGDGADGEGRDAAAPVGNVAAVAAPSQGPAPTSADADLQRTRTASAMLPGGGEGAHLDQRGILGGRPAVFPTLAGLPPERRDRVQGLLAALPSKLEERGLMTTVPGELLFAQGSDQVQTAAAYDTLAKVAELIGMYDNRQVLIIGHSDAMGDPTSNRQLSERRAEQVKDILVDSFEIESDRLSTEGRGDTLPIASNATPEGRRANRRVEVLILN